MGFWENALRVGAGAVTGGLSEVGIRGYQALSKATAPTHAQGYDPTANPADQANFAYGQGNGADTSASAAAAQRLLGAQQQSQLQGVGSQALLRGQGAQGRQAAQIAANPTDQRQQLAALGGLNQGAGALYQMGTQAQGPSAVAAQLHQGADAAMNQQLAMAASGRTLGGGAAAMRQAAFNNAGIQQSMNAQAATSRIQEDQAYRQSQLAALGASGQAYGAAAGQANAIRSGNEGLQLSNAQLGQGQQQINDQTTGLYNQLGLGMYGMGQQAGQFGNAAGNHVMDQQFTANQNMENMKAGGANTVAVANQQADTAHNDAMLNAGASVIGAGAGMAKSDTRAKENKVRQEATADTLAALGGAPGPRETTAIPANRALEFRNWLKANRVGDLDNPDSHYDYRGAFLGGVGRGASSGHFPDIYKQHGHPTFSIESQYSKNSNDGGSWDGEAFSPQVTPRGPDYGALDQAQSRAGGPIFDVRGAPNYSYTYKDPNSVGAAPGMQVGPMAQDLERTSARGAVVDTPQGKMIDGPRLALHNTGALGEQQRRIDSLERELAALGGKPTAMTARPTSYAAPRSQY